MNPIGIAMDGLLAGLLVLALILGLRLNKKLTALKAGHDDFARAVADLDAAALRAATALADLRRASEETHDSLLTRIETARALVARLEGLQTAATLAPTVTSLRAAPPPPLRRGGEEAASSPLRRGGDEALFSPLRGAGGVPAERGRGATPAADRLADLQRRPTRRPAPEDELFEPADAPLTLRRTAGDRR